MRLVTFFDPGMGPQLGLWEGECVYNLTATNPESCGSFIMLLQAARQAGTTPSELVATVAEKARRTAARDYVKLDVPPNPRCPYLLKPLEPTEIWAAGVTYERSRDAREAESHGATIYDRVYAAARPEIFFKGTGPRAVGPNHPVGARSDSRWQVPEPELALVVDDGGEIVGLTVGNDLTCRDIEAENPLYLPQAKIYKYACAIGPAVLLVPGEPAPRDIRMSILRAGRVIFAGKTSTGRLRRRCAELVRFMMEHNDLRAPIVLLTGTGIVPPDEVSLQAGDAVEIEIEGIGVLRNPVIAV